MAYKANADGSLPPPGKPEWRLDGAAMIRFGEALRELLSSDANYKPEAVTTLQAKAQS